MSRSSLLDALAVLGWLTGFAFLIFYWNDLGWRVAPALAAGWLIVLLVIQRFSGFKLFGPVLYHELVRLGRRRRGFIFRGLYALGLALIFCWIYALWSNHVSSMYGSRVPPHEQARFAEMFFIIFVVTQAILVAVMTPALTAGAIAEEKETRTLEYLLATDLRTPEIVFGKYASRVASMTMLVIAGLPLLSLTTFFGGIDPNLLLASFGATLTLGFSLAAVGLFCSTISRRARDAIVLTYLIAACYVGLSWLLFIVQFMASFTQGPVVPGYDWLDWEDVRSWLVRFHENFSAGEPLHAFMRIVQASRAGIDAELVAELLTSFVVFHGLVILTCVGYSFWRLRPIALAQRNESRGVSRARRVASNRPEIGSAPMLWKEVFVEGSVKLNFIGRAMTSVYLAICFCIPVLILVMAFFTPVFTPVFTPGSVGSYWDLDFWEQIGESMNQWVRVVGMLTTCLLSLGVAVRGAGSVTSEHERDTYTSLLTSPLESSEILWGKWYGSILGLRRGWFVLGLMWLLAMAMGGLHPLALPGLMLAVVIYASTLGWIGIYFSVTSTTTLRAVVKTVLTTLFLGGGYFLILGFCCALPMSLVGGFYGRDIDGLAQLGIGFCPLTNLFYLHFHEFSQSEIEMYAWNMPFVPFAIIGLGGWFAIGTGFAMRAISQFSKESNRMEYGPEYVRVPRRAERGQRPDQDTPLPIRGWE